MRHRITIQDETTPTDGTTQPTYADWRRNVRAKVEWRTGRETMRANADVVAIDDGMITLRFDKNISTRMRAKINHGGSIRTLNFTAVLPDDRAEWLVINFKEDIS